MYRMICIALVHLLFCSSIALADEIYKDKDGVWRNRPSQGASGQPGVYQDKEGVWRNSEPITGESVGKGLYQLGESFSNSDVWTGYMDIYQGFGKSLGESYKKRHMEGHLKTMEKIDRERAERIAEEESKKRVENPDSFERFDPSTAGHVKSEWEFFEDPR